MQEIVLSVASEVVLTLVGLALMALSTFGSFYIRKLMVSLEEKELVGVVRRYVLWAQQAPAFHEWSGEEKFAIVLSKAVQYARDKGLTVNEDEIAIMIEEAVKLMKDAAAPIFSDPIALTSDPIIP